MMVKLIFSLCGGLILWVGIAAAGPALRIDRLQVNIRGDATVQSELVAVLGQGEEVELLGSKDEWRRIRILDGREGWVHSRLVQERLLVTGNGVRIRSAGSVAAPSLAMVSTGDELGKLGGRGNWFEVRLADGRTGWIWNKLVRAKEISIAASMQEDQTVVEEEIAPAAEVEPVDREEEIETGEEEVTDEGSPAVVRGNPYAEGLQQAISGDHRAALASFLKVLQQDPGNLNALIHAARAHRQLGDYDSARQKLYQAMELGKGRRDIFRDLGEIYRLDGKADSAFRYQALFRGEEWIPQVEGEITQTDPESTQASWPLADMLWIYAAVVGGTSVVLMGLIFLLRRQKAKTSREGGEPAGRERGGKFTRAMRETRGRRVPVSGGEAAELEYQIQEKRTELRESAETFLGPEALVQPEGGTEDQHLEQMLGHIEALRHALEMQDERARLYADIIRLQNMKIETMSQELKLLRRRGNG